MPTTSVLAASFSDPRAAARDARLRYVADGEPGLTRRRRGLGFSYHDAAGARVDEPAVRERIRALAIPPAWEDVWICRDGRGHLQATGRDEAGRKQYLYHPRWREVRDRVKFDGLVAFGRALPSIRRRLRRDLSSAPGSRRRVTAAVVKLLDATLVRIGNRAYARNGSFGLTTLRDEHVATTADGVALSFVGKGGAQVDLSVRDEELAAVVRECQEIEGQELFRYVDEAGAPRSVGSGDVNGYLQAIAGDDVSAKDFRTWGATVLAARELHALGDAPSMTRRKRAVVASVRTAAGALGNTVAVCRRSYVHPRVLDAYLAGSFGDDYARALAAARGSRPRELRLHEAATLGFLAGGDGR
jgi:DNA topoisomerase I